MAIQKKHGKGRLDKWYKLAKEKGYRARAAFKLIQLNKKYGFLENSKVLLDLCAAPGSWCQVAAEVMPAQSIIVGVDLAPIKAIPRVITVQNDITTDQCRSSIRRHLKTWKADTVLHDGAPNVGVAWVQDAFSQAELVLQALKLATDFLIDGGTFVTKVFRSKDYNALLWVFKQLFRAVEATKPPSSRNVSAEIFVVCKGFKAPKKIDPKFLDPRHVFAELMDPTPNNEAKVFNPEKKKRKREGYEEGDYTQHKEVSVSDFIHTLDPIAILGSANKLSFEQGPNGDLALATLQRLPETTEEIRTCCNDLKVLGRKEFRSLLRWRLKVRDQFGLTSRTKNKSHVGEGEEVAEVTPMDEEMALQEELKRLQTQESSRKKRERRKENERKQKEIVRMQMQMITPSDIGMEQVGPNGEGAMFNRKTAEKADAVDQSKRITMEEFETDDDSDSIEAGSTNEESDAEGDYLEEQLDSLYDNYQERREDRVAKERAKRVRKEKETDEWQGLSGSEGGSDSGDADEEIDEEVGSTVQKVNLPSGQGLSNKAALFFDQDIFQDIDAGPTDDGDSAIEIDDDSPDNAASPEPGISSTETKEVSGKGLDGAKVKATARQRQEVSKSTNQKADPIEVVKNPTSDRATDPRKKNGQLDIDVITAEAMTLAQSLAKGETTTEDVVDDGFNKYTFRDVDGLPDWFLDDEGKHSKPQRPTTAAAAAAIREKLRALNARPIKKVQEARGRKKMKAAQKLEKLRKKSALLVDEDGMTEKDKATTIAKMMSKASKKKPKQQVKVVVAKGGNRGISGRPKGVKGKYKIVDSRLKKDVRVEKRLAKKRK
ncbi:MAG: hypothetical protein Q9160_001694 [Pyrenula sp. 1 TL-2023]